MTSTLHIENTVRDYESWKAAFDRFERFRADHGVRAYRISRQVADPSRVDVDLEFASGAEATAFCGHLERIWATPQSRAELVTHSAPVLMETLVSQNVLDQRFTA